MPKLARLSWSKSVALSQCEPCPQSVEQLVDIHYDDLFTVPKYK